MKIGIFTRTNQGERTRQKEKFAVRRAGSYSFALMLCFLPALCLCIFFSASFDKMLFINYTADISSCFILSCQSEPGQQENLKITFFSRNCITILQSDNVALSFLIFVKQPACIYQDLCESYCNVCIYRNKRSTLLFGHSTRAELW